MSASQQGHKLHPGIKWDAKLASVCKLGRLRFASRQALECGADKRLQASKFMMC